MLIKLQESAKKAHIESLTSHNPGIKKGDEFDALKIETIWLDVADEENHSNHEFTEITWSINGMGYQEEDFLEC